MNKADRPEVAPLSARYAQVQPTPNNSTLDLVRSIGQSRGRSCGALILVADDDELVRMICERTLLDAGFRVILAHDGRDALIAFNAHRAELAAVILDRTMPELTGEQVLAQIVRDVPGMPCVVSTGESEPEVLALFRSAGPLVFLTKPWRNAHLLAALDAVLQSSHST